MMSPAVNNESGYNHNHLTRSTRSTTIRGR